MTDNEKLFAIKLADADKKIRDKSLASIRRYMQSRSLDTNNDLFTEDELIKLWKGMHYCLWMCDKALIQEELNERLAGLIKCLNNNDEQVLLFIKVYFITIIREWNGIDKWRIDKFMMVQQTKSNLMRLMLRQMLAYLASKKWNTLLIRKFNDIILQYPLNINNPDYPDGVAYHISDIYLEELAKFGDSLKPIRAVKMLQPFFKIMATSQKKVFNTHLHKRMFEQIIECSDVGVDPKMEQEMDETVAFGLQLGEEEDTNEYSIKFNYEKIADGLFKIAKSKECLARNRKLIYDLVKKFRTLAKDIFPIDTHNFPTLDKPKSKPKPKKKKKISKRKKNILQALASAQSEQLTN